MTKERITFTLSRELYEVIAFRASAKQMNLSEYLESRLRMLPEIQKQIEIFQNLPEDPIIDTTKIEKETGKKIPAKISPRPPTEIDTVLLSSQ